ATILVSGYSGIYDGNAHGASGTATGAAGVSLSGLLHLGSTFTNVPGGTANWTFDGDNNYNPAAGSVAIVIAKADVAIAINGYSSDGGTVCDTTPLASATTTIIGYSPTYNGASHTAGATATGVTAENLSELLHLRGTTHTTTGIYATDAWSFAGNANYNPASG